MITEEKQKQILSDNLRFYIERSGKMQRDVALDLDINPPTFNQWVRGKALPSVSALRNVAEYFHVSLTDLACERQTAKSAASIQTYLNDETIELVIAYSNADDYICKAVKKLLDMVAE